MPNIGFIVVKQLLISGFFQGDLCLLLIIFKICVFSSLSSKKLTGM